MFQSVLVANRGEIAVRIMRTLRRLGIRSVGVYSDDDRSSRHIQDADVSVRLGPAPATESYLSIDLLLRAAIETGAHAIHPGYGFLAENADFASACHRSGIVFIGPSVHAINVMGDKIQAKRTVSAAGVPVVPGRIDPDMSDDDLIAAADDIGYPVLVKPSAGGGGKGMRLVHDPLLLKEALAGARREAKSAFGDDTLFIERFVLSPRHIEIQVVADSFGSVVHLGERECSLQRRHQKIVEESPSVLLSAQQRHAMGLAASDIARAVTYEGVGTVEFILSADDPGAFFFMEMNTRLQVEHPVTELVTGIDLVEQQLLVAAGEPLRLKQDEVALSGHAVEARVYAENPDQGFVPSAGAVHFLREAHGEGIRVDSSLLPGQQLSTAYDPLLSKVVAWAPDRTRALARLNRALAGTVILGFATNINFLRSLLSHEDVLTGRVDAGLVERALPQLLAGPPPPAAYVALVLDRLMRLQPTAAVADPWEKPNGWRLGAAPAPICWKIAAPDGTPIVIELTGGLADAQVVIGDGAPLSVRVVSAEDELLVTVDGHTHHAVVVVDAQTAWIWIDGATYSVTMWSSEGRSRQAGAEDDDVRSPMPGTVVVVNVKAGDDVAKGDKLVIVEAMKMEHSLVAPRAGKVSQVLATVGERVLPNTSLVHLEPVPIPSDDLTGVGK
ncbi:MAG: biotin carboxylase N-terminal domain-containing protein [Acidimicrobiales bacterium]